MATAAVKDSRRPVVDVQLEPGKVVEVRNQLLLQGDEGLAQRLQEEEFGAKYNWNRAERQTARTDVPLAKYVQSEEEEQMQREQFERLEREKQRLENDSRVAMQMEQEERMREDLERIERRDVKLAQQLQQKESEIAEMTQDDALIAMQMQREELIRKHAEAKQRELEDRSLARRLQQREQQLAELARIERELQRQQQTTTEPQPVQADANIGGNVLHRQLRFPVEEEQLVDSNQEDLLYAQDQEMARALQELEIDQAKATRRATHEHLYDIASSDARLARILQEQEKLEALRRAEERRIRRLQREQQMQPRMVLRTESCAAAVPTPPPYEQSVAPQHAQRHRGDGVGRTRSQFTRVGGVTNVQQLRPLQSQQESDVLHPDFLRYDESAVRAPDVSPELSGARVPGSSYYQPAMRANSAPEYGYSQNDDDDHRETRMPRQPAKRSSKNSCKQQ